MFCPKCGNENANNAEFCGSCGIPLEKDVVASMPATSTESAQKSVKKNGRLIRIAAAVVVLIAVIAGIATGGFGLLGSGVEVKSSTEDYTWEELSKISSEISRAPNEEGAVEIAKKYNLTNSEGRLDGSQTKSIQLSDGQNAQAQIVGFRHDDKVAGGKAGITFIFVNAIDEEQMTRADTSEGDRKCTNAGGWEKSEMRSVLASYGMALLPSDLKNVIVEVNKKTNNVGETLSTDSVTITADKLWLFSVEELCGLSDVLKAVEEDISRILEESDEAHRAAIDAIFVLAEEGEEYKLFRDQSVDFFDENKILEKSLNGNACSWWERSANPPLSDRFFIVTSGCPSRSGYAWYPEGVVPGFCI